METVTRSAQTPGAHRQEGDAFMARVRAAAKATAVSAEEAGDLVRLLEQATQCQPDVGIGVRTALRNVLVRPVSPSFALRWQGETSLADLAETSGIHAVERLPNDPQMRLEDFRDAFPCFRDTYSVITLRRAMSAVDANHLLPGLGYRPATLREVLHLLKVERQMLERYPTLVVCGSISIGRRARKYLCLTRRDAINHLSCRFADAPILSEDEHLVVADRAVSLLERS